MLVTVSAASINPPEFVRSAYVVVDYTKEDFAEVLSGCDVVLDSRGGENLERSLTVLKPGGQAIGVSGPPDPGFARRAVTDEDTRRRQMVTGPPFAGCSIPAGPGGGRNPSSDDLGYRRRGLAPPERLPVGPGRVAVVEDVDDRFIGVGRVCESPCVTFAFMAPLVP